MRLTFAKGNKATISKLGKLREQYVFHLSCMSK